MKYFKAKTKEGLYEEYKTLAKMYHPDNIKTGDEHIFKEVANEYIIQKKNISADDMTDLHVVATAARDLLNELLEASMLVNYRFVLLGTDLDFIISKDNSIKDIEIMVGCVQQVQRHGYKIQSYLEFDEDQLLIIPLSYGLSIMKNAVRRIPAPTSTSIYKNYVVTECGKVSVGSNVCQRKMIYLERPLDDLTSLIRHKSVRKKDN